MMRSLYSGVAGLKTHQTRMDVIGNNIANVNTTSYKSQSMTFSDLMYQTTQAASGANPTTGVGGINARQIGLGAKTSAIKTAITGQGASQTTNDPFDLMITGESFFVVNNGNENFFTRDGSFYVDGAGNLCMTSTGYNVMGWQPDTVDPTVIKRDNVTPLRVMTAANMTYPPAATTQATVSGVVDKFDTDISSATATGRVMNLEIFDKQGYKYTVRMKVIADTGDDVNKGQFTVKLDKVLDSEGNELDITGVGFENGGTTDLKLKFYAEDSTDVGAFQGIGADFAAAAAAGNSTTTINLSDISPNFSDVTVDFSDTSNYNVNGVSTVGALRGDKAGRDAGRKIGEMSGISISKDGMIFASYDNGQRRLLGQIAVANFANASGLAKQGDNLYSATQNSGEFDGIGDDITEGGGYMNSGVLEMSNVDLSAEFTEMITTQRGFQANSRIITVSDTLLEELTNLKR